MVQKTLIRPPVSRLGPITPAERIGVMEQSPVRGLYDTAQDRDSAFEKLQARTAAAQEAIEAPVRRAPEPSPWGGAAPPERQRAQPRASNRQGMGEAFAKSLLRQAGSTIARELMRGVMGSLKKRR
jgi:hypothetical protein